jgi:diacylglycerol kinase (ATP)
VRVKVILNPYAKRGLARKQVSRVRSVLADSGIKADLTIIERKSQARQEAMAAAFGPYDAVVVAGGDGTLHDVINGLMIASSGGQTCPVGILPLGTANDFYDMAGLPPDLDDAVQVIAGGSKRQIDAGSVRYVDDSSSNGGSSNYQGCFFDNNCALAMEPVVTQQADQITFPSGSMRYVVAVAKTLLHMKAWNMQIVWDNGAYEGPIYLLSIANTPRTGGVFMISPEASMDDGLFDFVFAPVLPKAQVLALLPRLLNGSHIHHPKVVSGRTTKMHIKSQPGTPIHADGEIISEGATMVEYRILPGKITLLAPN